MINFGTKLKEKILKYGLLRPSRPTLVGCSDAEIAEVKAAQKVTRLPAIYHSFLKVLGKEAGDAFPDFYSYASLLWMKDAASELLIEENIPLKIPDDAFVFYGWDGNYLFFHTANLDDDPAVWGMMLGWDFGQAAIVDIDKCLSKYFDDGVEGLHKQLNPRITKFE